MCYYLGAGWVIGPFFCTMVLVITMSCDGSFSKDGGTGGWAAVIRRRDRVWRVAEGGDCRCHNVAELKAVVLALRWLNRPSTVKIVTDSTWLIGTVQRLPKLFTEKGAAKGDHRRALKELWELMEGHDVDWEWKKRCSTWDLMEADFLSRCMNLGPKGIAEQIAFWTLMNRPTEAITD